MERRTQELRSGADLEERARFKEVVGGSSSIGGAIPVVDAGLGFLGAEDAEAPK